MPLCYPDWSRGERRRQLGPHSSCSSSSAAISTRYLQKLDFAIVINKQNTFYKNSSFSSTDLSHLGKSGIKGDKGDKGLRVSFLIYCSISSFFKLCHSLIVEYCNNLQILQKFSSKINLISILRISISTLWKKTKKLKMLAIFVYIFMTNKMIVFAKLVI